jgi:spoIIIJ-associated protein
MNDPKRRFFSGDSLQQALVQAANHYNLDPEEIAYRSLDKKHGFLKTRRKVMIEVNPDAPKKEKAAPAPPRPQPAPAAPPRRAAVPTEDAERPASEERPAHRDRPERSERAPRGGGGREGGRRDEPRRRDDRRDDRREGRRDDRRREGAAPRYARPVEPSRPEPEDQEDPPQPRMVPGMPDRGLVALPDAPRRPSERFPPATGPMAEAAIRGAELLLSIAGLELTPRVLQGEDRLEVDLSGPDVDWCFADDGELVMAVEHLLPRLIRSMSGETTLVRVDCDNFQEIREERLRSLAQRVAEEVRRRNKPRTLEPMNPADRRIVHMTLADDPGVVTESEGDGYFKRITVRPA